MHAHCNGSDRCSLEAVWHILSDGDFELVLANAAHVKNVPGLKTDVKHADWVSDLLAHA
jgi:transposase